MLAKHENTKSIDKYMSRISVISMLGMSYLSVFVFMTMMFYEL
ncbi:MAG: hypothetical protein VZR27_04025 [Acutalibacteraceae bacterium]|nr:hypothetical protein [Acutalibacteraceae bacterium]